MKAKPSHDYDVHRIIRSADLTPSQKLMLWAIYDHAGPHGTGKCWTSAENLAKECGIQGDPDNLSNRGRKLIEGLKDQGWVRVVTQGKSKHASRRDIYVGPKVWDALGIPVPSGDDPHSVSEDPALGIQEPALGAEMPSHSVSGYLQTSLGTSPKNDHRNVARSRGMERASERGSHAHSGAGEGNPWGEVWKALVPPKDEWWSPLWETDRAAAYAIASELSVKAEHLRPAIELVVRKPSMLTARGASWTAVAAAIVRASEQDPDNIRSLPRLINTLALEHHSPEPRPIHPWEAEMIAWARRRNDGMRKIEADLWRTEAMGPALARWVPEAGRAFEAVNVLNADRFNRRVKGSHAYGLADEFADRVRDLSAVVDDDGWRRLADAAEDAVITGATDLPALDELLRRSQGGEDGHAEAAG